MLFLRSSQCKEVSQLVMTRRHKPNPSLNFGFDEYCPRSAQLDVILHSLDRNSKRPPKIESCDDKTPTYGSGNKGLYDESKGV